MLVAVIGESFPRRLSSMISWRKVPQEMLRRRGRSDSQTRIRRPAPGAHHAGERMSLGYPSPIQQSGGSSRAEQQALALSAEGASMTVRPLGGWCLSRVEMLAIRSQLSQNYR
jgi:hypothetical protein